jgi:hypothetical protein
MKKNNQTNQSDNMNYNDRLDGYGFGESESKDCDLDYVKDPHFTKHCIDFGEGYRRHKDEPFTKDEFGLRNQYGPVDQYVFRSYHLFTRVKPEENKQEKENHKNEEG